MVTIQGSHPSFFSFLHITKLAIKRSFLICFIFVFAVSVSEVYSETKTSDIPYSEIERQTRLLLDRYFRLQKRLEKVLDFSNKPLPHTGINISLKKNTVTFNLKALELILDKNFVSSHSYSEEENSFLDMAGRQILYERDLSQGKHILSINVFLQIPESGNVIIREKEELEVYKNETLFLEIQISEMENQPIVKIGRLGTSQKENTLLSK